MRLALFQHRAETKMRHGELLAPSKSGMARSTAQTPS
jgi:hypothetical protein